MNDLKLKLAYDACFNGRVVSLKHICQTNNIAITSEFLEYACHGGYLKMVKYVCESDGVDPSYNDNIAVRISSQYGRIDVVKYLCICHERRIDPTAGNNWALRLSCINGHHDVSRYLWSLDAVRKPIIELLEITTDDVTNRGRLVDYLCNMSYSDETDDNDSE